MDERKTKIYELITGIFLLAADLFLLHTAHTAKYSMGAYAGTELSPMWFPKLILYGLLIFTLIGLGFCLSWFWRHRRDKHSPIVFFELFHKKSVITYGLMIAYALLWKFVGFSLSTFLFFGVQAKVMDKERPIGQLAVISLVFTVGLNVVFSTLFHVNFPEPLFNAIYSAIFL